MTNTSWTEICVSDFEQSILWFENVLGFRVEARDGNEYAEMSRGETSIQLAADDAPVEVAVPGAAGAAASSRL